MKLETSSQRISLSAPAKVNLFLAITGKRSDGFHELVSLMAKVDLCDLITLEKTDRVGEISCDCRGNEQLSGEGNLAWKAVDLWREVTGEQYGVRVTIQKNIPLMAGLGGGSSDAVATLKALNSFRESPLGQEELIGIAARLGSDCPSFLIEGACVATGRGEVVRPVSQEANSRLNGKKVFLFKPPLGFSTAEIYKSVKGFSSKEEAAGRIHSWEKEGMNLEDCIENDLENPVFEKYLFMNPLFEGLKAEFGLSPVLSGSGSCCFAILPDDCAVEPLTRCIKESWGEETFVAEQRICS